MTKQLFFDQFLKFIEKENLFSIQDHILLAVSGGIDSMVLCHLFEQADFQYSIAHVNHHTRGESSNLDSHFVENWANNKAVSFYSMSLDPANYKAPGVNFHEYARNKRYAWFKGVLKKMKLNFVATAHHKNDSVESALMHFAMGAGLQGMSGIQLKTNRIIRPLMFATKTEIEQFANREGIQYREDESNQSDSYRRNALRHHVLSKLVEIYPEFETTAFRSVQNLSDSEILLSDLVLKFQSSWVQVEGKNIIIDKSKIESFKGNQTLLYYLLKPYGFSSSQTKQISGDNKTGAQYYSPSHRLLVNRNEWLLTKTRNKISADIVIPGPGIYQLSKTEKLVIEEVDKFENTNDPCIEIIDAGSLKLPMVLKRWKKGDHFQPIGMNGHSQKIQDYFINNKIDLFTKMDSWVLWANEYIIWLLPFRLDERVKVKKKSKILWKLSYQVIV